MANRRRVSITISTGGFCLTERDSHSFDSVGTGTVGTSQCVHLSLYLCSWQFGHFFIVFVFDL